MEHSPRCPLPFSLTQSQTGGRPRGPGVSNQPLLDIYISRWDFLFENHGEKKPREKHKSRKKHGKKIENHRKKIENHRKKKHPKNIEKKQ